MKAQDLRLGNYIEYTDDSRECIIKEIDGHGCVVFFDDDGVENWIELLQLSPIQITHDWLVKFNFDLEWIIEHNTKFICLYQEGDSFYYSADMHHHTSAPIKYVHQLQNLFFALTGEELTIK